MNIIAADIKGFNYFLKIEGKIELGDFKFTYQGLKNNATFLTPSHVHVCFIYASKQSPFPLNIINV